MTNPAVREYLYSVDNVTSTNLWGRCGVWRDGQWIQKYSGARIDPAYVRDIAAWMKWLGERVHAACGCLAANHYFEGIDARDTRKSRRSSTSSPMSTASRASVGRTVTDQKWLERVALFHDIARTRPVVIIDQVFPQPIASLARCSTGR